MLHRALLPALINFSPPLKHHHYLELGFTLTKGFLDAGIDGSSMTRPCLPLSTTVPSESVRHEYIARYAYRVAITNSRILDVTDSNVSYFSSASCHSPFGNHTKTDIFPHNNQITFTAAVLRSGASYRLAGDTKPILLLVII